MNTNSIITIVAVIVVIGIGGFFLLQGNGTELDQALVKEQAEHSDSAMTDGSTGDGTVDSSKDKGDGMEENENGDTSMEVPASDTDPDTSEMTAKTGATVTYTDDGFNPRTLTISAGGTVTFVNESSRDMWPASAIHPTHTIYPGSDIRKCGTAEESTIFDACGAVAPGGSWSFTFTEVGEWRYHDHRRSNNTGTIIVQ